MLTLGVDLASADERTAMARIEWAGGAAVVRELQLGVSDNELVAAIGGVDQAGVDCPLGWPSAFVDFVVAHRAGTWRPVDADASWRRTLAYRVTDQVVRAEVGINPLSVSADRIAYVAFRCANLLAQLPGHNVVEVYPAASLRRWGLTHRGYKVDGHDALLDALLAAAPWLDLGPYGKLARTSHDAFDAVIAALAARAAAIGCTLLPTADQQEAARTEGWIALPTGELKDLP
ncbi:DUF429 domain-containing protein [Actinoplanes bogorensis]|uniref:DUF429 domain-containing protein n=1 Tax=Paractinoplanes bogorensis TaxID=1610840 RepID=A0ABS5Z3U0_9ACTN|nr:DUF429 domain-containing protein [Actinoplanes bogorensis]MBU2669603.1 DUF429 domain-containing protein [Actinoplanes bogorensis]